MPVSMTASLSEFLYVSLLVSVSVRVSSLQIHFKSTIQWLGTCPISVAFAVSAIFCGFHCFRSTFTTESQLVFCGFHCFQSTFIMDPKLSGSLHVSPAVSLYIKALMAAFLAAAYPVKLEAKLLLPIWSASCATLFSIWYRYAFSSAGMMLVV